MEWRFWFRGLIAAAINSAAGGVAIVVVDPHTFGDWHQLVKVCAVLAITGAALYLKQHPLPEDDDHVTPPRL